MKRKTKSISVTLDKATVEAVDLAAKKENRNRSSYLNNLLKKVLKIEK